jgi:hypothetical protein
MSKNTNLSFLTDYITADITNGRIGINNASPTVAFDVSGATRISGALTLTSTISNGTYTYTLPSATGTLALTSAISGTTNYVPKFTASGTIGNSAITDDGTTVTLVNRALSGTSSTFNSMRSITKDGYILRSDDNTLNLGGLTRRSFWFGGTALDTQIFAETGYGIFLNVGGSVSSGLTLASTGAATFSSGIGIGGATATTGGIQFPATQVAIADANNLDDYEEGTFTPAIAYSTSGSPTYFSRAGFYTKIGNQVHISVMTGFNENTGVGNLSITGLPFTSSNLSLYRTVGSGWGIGMTGLVGGLQVYIGASSTSLQISQTNGGVGATHNVTNANTSSDTDLYVSITYFTL